jgi:hypothetical protein
VLLHIVLFQPRATMSAADRDAFIGAFENALTDIPSIRHARVGKRVVHGRQYEALMPVDYSYAAIIEFDDVNGLKEYLAHPSHTQLGEKLFEVSQSLLIYDFEAGDPRAL